MNARRCVLLCALFVVVSCAGWKRSDAPRACERGADEGVIAADERADRAYDRSLDIDCGSVRKKLACERSSADTERAKTALADLRAQRPHLYVARKDLVDMMRPAVSEGGPADNQERVNTDRILGMTTCDPLTREIATRNYVAAHPELWEASTPATGRTP